MISDQNWRTWNSITTKIYSYYETRWHCRSHCYCCCHCYHDNFHWRSCCHCQSHHHSCCCHSCWCHRCIHLFCCHCRTCHHCCHRCVHCYCRFFMPLFSLSCPITESRACNWLLFGNNQIARNTCNFRMDLTTKPGKCGNAKNCTTLDYFRTRLIPVIQNETRNYQAKRTQQTKQKQWFRSKVKNVMYGTGLRFTKLEKYRTSLLEPFTLLFSDYSRLTHSIIAPFICIPCTAQLILSYTYQKFRNCFVCMHTVHSTIGSEGHYYLLLIVLSFRHVWL